MKEKRICTEMAVTKGEHSAAYHHQGWTQGNRQQWWATTTLPSQGPASTFSFISTPSLSSWCCSISFIPVLYCSISFDMVDRFVVAAAHSCRGFDGPLYSYSLPPWRHFQNRSKLQGEEREP